MTVQGLIDLLGEYPPELPVFSCPATDGLTADHPTVAPQDAVMNLVDPDRRVAMAFSPDGEGYVYRTPPDGYMDALVIYPKALRETE
jgi:hypothetical protein